MANKKVFTDESLATLVSEIKAYTDDAVSTKADSDHTHPEATIDTAGLLSAEDKIQLNYGGIPIVTTSGDGAAYTATVDGMAELKVGMSIVMIPHTASTSVSPTLNVNSLGAKSIRRMLSNSTTSTVAGYNTSWLASNKPIRVTYNGSFWIADSAKPSAADISGTISVANGGTGATTAAAALTNLGLTATASELNFMEGVTNNVQTQFDFLSSEIASLKASVVTVYSGTAADMGSDVGSDGDVYLVTE